MVYFVGSAMRKILYVFFASILFSTLQPALAQHDSLHAAQDTLHRSVSGERPKQSRADSIIQYAYTFMGDRYRRGGTGAKGFDCSGYTMTVFKHFGIRLPHTSAGQGLIGIEVNRANIRKGDLILFKGRSRRSARIGHVGIVISEKGEPVRFIHSSTGDGVKIDRLEFDYYRRRYVKTVRVPELYR